MNILAVIPARGGSKGIPRKNIRFISGKPLISYAIQTAIDSKYITDVLVSTDDSEIEYVSRIYGAEIVRRPDYLGKDSVTLDPVIYNAVVSWEKNNNKSVDIVITMQPTSPLLKCSTVDAAIENYLESKAETMISAVNAPHLSWGVTDGKYHPFYKERLNRQYLPKNLKETGAFVITRRKFIKENTRFGNNISIYEMPESEAIDIDSYQDWWICERILRQKKIIIRTDGYSEIGMGHIYRSIFIAMSLNEHNVKLVVNKNSSVGIEKIKNSNIPFELIKDDDDFINLVKKEKADIVVNDILNTNKEYIQKLKKEVKRVVNFEDIGEGAYLADAVINALYNKTTDNKKFYWGSQYVCLREEFLLTKAKHISKNVDNILILFGGTDPCDLTQKVFNVVKSWSDKSDIKFTFVLGLGYRKSENIINLAKDINNIDVLCDVKMMTSVMKNADIAISSQGRTMYELAKMGIPTILISQNERETEHKFGYLDSGFINLGLGNNVSEVTIMETLNWLINCYEIRKQMHDKMLSIDLETGINRVDKIILESEDNI